MIKIDINEVNTVGHKLFTAMKLLHKAQWQHSIDGNKPSEMSLMICISKHNHFTRKGLMVSEISRLMSIASPTVTQLINSLESREMVERQADPSDRRVVRVKLTKLGESIARRAKKHMDNELDKLVNYLGEEESDQLAELLLKVHAYAMDNPVNLDELQMNGDEKFD